MEWKEREMKERARIWLLNQVDIDANHFGKYRYAGLPAGSAIFEKNLVKMNPSVSFSLELFEKDEETFNSLASDSFSRTHGVVHHSDIDDFLLDDLEGKTSFRDFVYLDYCGPITVKRLKVLRACLLSTTDLFAVTFSAMRETSDATTVTNYLSSSFTDRGLDLVLPEKAATAAIMKRVKAVSEAALSIVPNLEIRVLPYRDTVPMFLMTFKRSARRATIFIEPYLDLKEKNR